MSRYIDIKWLDENAKEYSLGYYDYDEYAVPLSAVEDAPTIEIIRCGECKWGKPYSDKQLECNALGLGGLKFPYDFCSYGSRSEKPNNSKVSEKPTGSERSSE